MFRKTSGRNLATEINLRIKSVSTPISRNDYSPTEIENLPIRVSTVHDSAEVEHLRTIVNFSPESILESFLLRFESGGRLDEIEMSEDGDELR